MKKYIKTVSILAVVLVTFAIYYINNDVITGVNPELKVENISGDAAVVDNILLTGTIYDDETIYDVSFTWQKGKTIYDTELSFLQQLSERTDSIRLKQYEKDYRSFMRGTVREETFFYEDDEVLAYAGTPYSFFDFEMADFDVKLLHKERDDVTKFTVPIPDRGKYWHVAVTNVYYEDGKIYVTTENEQNTVDDTGHTVVMVNVFDIKEEKLVDQKVVAENKEQERYDGYTILETLVDEAEAGVVYIAQSDYSYDDGLEDTSEMDFAKEEIDIVKIMKLDVVQQKLTEIDVPDKLFHGNVMYAHDGVIYSDEIEDKKMTLHRLNVNDKKIDSLEIPLTYTSDVWSVYSEVIDLKDDTLYFTVDYLEGLEKAPLIAVDLTDFTLLYEGEIVPQLDETKALTKQVYFEQSKALD